MKSEKVLMALFCAAIMVSAPLMCLTGNSAADACDGGPATGERDAESHGGDNSRGTFTEGMLRYSINEDYVTLTVTDYMSKDFGGAIGVPHTVTHDGFTYTVTAIGDWGLSTHNKYHQHPCCFYVGSNIEKIGAHAFDCTRCSSSDLRTERVVFEDPGVSKLRSIGEYAFSGILWKNASIPASVQTIGKCAFSECPNLKSVEFNSPGLEIGESAFKGCEHLSEVKLGGATRIGDLAFQNCAQLPSSNLDFSSVRYIGKAAFEGCNKFETISLPNVVSIDKWAFKNCKNLGHMEIGGSMEAMEKQAFFGCSKLKDVWISAGHDYVIGEEAFAQCTSLENINLDHVRVIGKGAFRDCTGLGNMEIGGPLELIDSRAFFGCTNLMNVWTTAGHDFEIGESAFAQCTSLKSIDLGHAKTIGRCAFKDCKSLGHVEIGKSLQLIDYQVFFGCSNLTNVVIDSGEYIIGESAFAQCTSLGNIELYCVKTIGRCAFEGCNSLVHVEIGDSLELISFEAFHNCVKLKDVVIAAERSYVIKEYAFNHCESLENINLEHAGIIYKGAFANCYCLSEVNLSSCTALHEDVFDGDKAIKRIVFSDLLNHICGDTFDLRFLDLDNKGIKLGDSGLSKIRGKEFVVLEDGCMHEID